MPPLYTSFFSPASHPRQESFPNLSDCGCSQAFLPGLKQTGYLRSLCIRSKSFLPGREHDTRRDAGRSLPLAACSFRGEEPVLSDLILTSPGLNDKLVSSEYLTFIVECLISFKYHLDLFHTLPFLLILIHFHSFCSRGIFYVQYCFVRVHRRNLQPKGHRGIGCL